MFASGGGDLSALQWETTLARLHCVQNLRVQCVETTMAINEATTFWLEDATPNNEACGRGWRAGVGGQVRVWTPPPRERIYMPVFPGLNP